LGYGGYGLEMVLECFGCDFDMVWERGAFFSVPDGLASRNETETTRGSLLVDFSRVLVVLI